MMCGPAGPVTLLGPDRHAPVAPTGKEQLVTVPSDVSRTVDAGRLWTGGVATALVAALVAFVGVLIARGLFGVPVLAPTEEGTLGDASTFQLAALAALAALLATGLLHLLLVSTPQPRRFFGWIMALATLAVTLLPFLTDADLGEQVATAAIYLAIGVSIGSLLSGVALRATRLRS
jgi:hypothetical protein